MLKNLFGKKAAANDAAGKATDGDNTALSSAKMADALASMPGAPDPSKMNMLQVQLAMIWVAEPTQSCKPWELLL